MTCSELKMNQFIAALLGDLSHVGAHWEDIYNEYVSLRENKASSYILDLMKEITYLQTKVFIIQKCVEVLARVYSAELVLEVKQCGCKGKFNWDDPVKYSADLKAALSFATKYKAQADRKNKELEDYHKLHGDEIVSRKQFDVQAITLTKFLGVWVDYDVMTVAQYCHAMNQYDAYCEVTHAEHNNILEQYGRR